MKARQSKRAKLAFGNRTNARDIIKNSSQVRSPTKMDAIVYPTDIDHEQSWAEREFHRLTTKKNKFNLLKKKAFFVSIIILGIIPFVVGVVIIGALLLTHFGCSSITFAWGLLCGLGGVMLYIKLDKIFNFK